MVEGRAVVLWPAYSLPRVEGQVRHLPDPLADQHPLAEHQHGRLRTLDAGDGVYQPQLAGVRH